MKITFFGTGYVGLVQATVFAEVGHDVMCVDLDARKIADLEKGVMPIFEPGLDHLVEKNREHGRLAFTVDPQTGVDFGEIIFIAVGTPSSEDGSADLQGVLGVAAAIARHMNAPKTIVNKSTVPVGTVDRVRETMEAVLRERGVDFSFDVVSNPEFLKEGSAVNDCMRPDRIIIGTDNPAMVKKMRELYAPFTANRDCILFMDGRSAELTKYTANCMLATKISFMNEISNLAERLGADIENVRLGIGADKRIGYDFLYPGCGYGGSCFPKDILALIRTGKDVGYESEFLKAVIDVNYRQKNKLFELISRHFKQGVAGMTFAVWGLSFKPNTDDMREAPSRNLMEALWRADAKVRAYDPEALNEARRIYGDRDDLALVSSKEEALHGAAALVICTEWSDFRAPDFSLIKASLAQPVIFDGRNLYNVEHMAEMGFVYYGIARGASLAGR